MSSWKRMVQELDYIPVDRMVELTRTEVRRKKMIWNASMADSVKEVTESARACSCYPVSAGSSSGRPRLYQF